MGNSSAIRRVGTVTASVSRNAGGLFESVRSLTFSVASLESFDNLVFSLADENTQADKGAWAPLSVKVFGVWGPDKFGFAPRLQHELTDAGLDIIHNHGMWMYPSVAVPRSAKRRSIPYVVSAHGMLDRRALANSRWKKRVAEVLYERRHLEGAACLRALCDSEAEAMRSFGLRNPICVIPNGMNLPAPSDVEPPHWVSDVPSGKRILLYLGRIHPKKGLPNLLRAWARMHAVQSEWQLVIAGWDQGGHQARLSALARELGISPSVSFVGPQFNEAKRSSYSHADAFVLPSVSEGLPMVVLEAWAFALPVAMTPECNLPEGFRSGAAHEISCEVEEMAARLRAFLSLSDSQLSDMGRRGRSLVQTNFTWKRIGEEMGRVYDWILGGGAPPACVRL